MDPVFPRVPDDLASPDALLAALYEVISGPPGPRDWARFRRLFRAGARLVPLGEAGATVLGVEDYVARASHAFAAEAFHEREVGRREERYGALLHAWSAYETRRAPDAPPFQRGVNSVQMVHEAGQWRILSLAWQAERPGLPLPPKYAPRHEVRRIRAEEARPLRLRVLRPGQPPESVVYPADDLPDTLHLGAFHDGALVGVATLQRGPDPRDGRPAWQLRGMATAPEARGQGHGAALVRAAEEHVRRHGGHELWFNARVVALGFYERLGYVREGPEFDIPGIGPHYVMRKAL